MFSKIKQDRNIDMVLGGQLMEKIIKMRHFNGSALLFDMLSKQGESYDSNHT